MFFKILITNRAEITRPTTRKAQQVAIRVFAMCALAFALSLPSASATAAQDAAPRVTTYSFKSAALKQERRFHVYTPPEYGQSQARYPVLYLLDGGLDQWLPTAVATLDAIAAEGQTDRLLIVGIASKNRELDFDKRPDLMRRYLLEEVKPLIERQYRTQGDGMLFGWSLGGLFVVDTLLRAPDSFDDYVAVSPSLWRNEQALARSARGRLDALPTTEHRLWLSMADEGSSLGMGALVAALKARAPATLRWTYAPLPQQTHGTVYLPALRDAVRAFHPPRARAGILQMKSKG